ncbi:MAG: FprA family A-type flavoprotein [Bacteroidales bacterium]
MYLPEIKSNIYYLGVNDRKKHLFENIVPELYQNLAQLPFAVHGAEQGVAYNSYLILDKKTALIDTVDIGMMPVFLQKLQTVLQGRTLDYIVVNHMEPDHAAGIEQVTKYYPDVIVVGNKKTLQFISYYFTGKFNTMEVAEGQEISLGEKKISFIFAPMVHWPEVMLTYEHDTQTIFSADAFGCFGTLDGGCTDATLDMERYDEEYLRYYSNIVGKYGNPVQQLLKKITAIDISTVAPSHGPVLTQKESIQKLVKLYKRLSLYEGETGVVIVYGSMYGNTETMAEAIAGQLSLNGVQHIRIFDASKTHASYIIRDIFRYKGLIIGSPTYNSEIYPVVSSLIDKIAGYGVKNRLFSAFGSYTWADQASKKIADFGQKMGWDTVYGPISTQGTLNECAFEEIAKMSKLFAIKLLQK